MTYSTTYANAVNTLGEPVEETKYPKGDREHVVAKWNCECEFHETESGSGILFACDEHGD